MKNKYRILKILVVVVLLAFLLNFSLNRFAEKKISNVKVNFNQSTPVYFLKEDEIKELVKHSTPENKIGNLDIPMLENNLKKLPIVDSANVYLNLNGVLNVDVKQRVPVMRISNGNRNFYVDAKGKEIPVSSGYSHPCMLVSGNIPKDDYPKLSELVTKINADPFCKNFFVGISNKNNNYYLLTDEGNYKVEIGDLDNIDFKIKGFKTFAEKYLVYQDSLKYSKISVKYNNQIITTLRNGFHSDADSLLDKKKPVEKKVLIKKEEHKEPKKEEKKKEVKEKPKAKEKVREKEKAAKSKDKDRNKSSVKKTDKKTKEKNKEKVTTPKKNR